MKTSTKILAGLGLISGIGLIVYLIDKKFSFGLTNKLQATVFDLWGIGKGNMQHNPTEDTSKDTILMKPTYINPHDSYNTFAGVIDESYVNSF